LRAFVLSGGSVLGSAQVGALQALLQQGISPDFLVGTSAGALNAAYLAADCSLAQVERLATLWRVVTRADVYPGTHLDVGWRLCVGADSLYDNRKFHYFLQQHGMLPTKKFADLADVACRVTATHLQSGQLRVFGENPDETVLDALMASTALPPLHAPWVIDGEPYIDGGMVAPLPVQVALDQGATEIYALQVLADASDPAKQPPLRGVPALMARSMSMTLQYLVKHELARAMATPGVRIHDIKLRVPDSPDLIDFSHANRLFEIGYREMYSYLRQSRSLPRQRTPTYHPQPTTGQPERGASLLAGARQLVGEPG
jgi:NTE family protein